jgi:hypothetical protein
MRNNSIPFIAGFAVATVAVAIWLSSAAHAGSKGSGKPSVSDINVTKSNDKSSQTLMRKSSGTGKPAKLTVRKAGKGQD